MAGGDAFAKKLKARIAQTKTAKGKTLEVGFFEDATYSADDGGEKVAEVAFWNEFGAPENNQPARHFFRDAISENSGNWLNFAKEWVRDGVSLDIIMGRLGVIIQEDIKRSILEFETPALSPVTIAIKKAQGKSDADAAKPLIDTFTMLNAVQWVIQDD